MEGTLRTREQAGKSGSSRRTEVFVGADGVFAVYDSASTSGHNPESALSPEARHSGSHMASARVESSGGPSELPVPEDWPSFEGLSLNDLTDTPE
ncbi:TPA: hypothetical protein L6A07_29175 [Pseudomonas aeruginosa]|nr:hypothetical protein [Pseudomonas aeruginosa]